MAATTAAGDHCAGEPAARGLPPRLLGWMLVLVVLGTYLPALRHGFVCLDDNAYVTANRHVQAGLTWDGLRWAFTSTEAANWHPLTWLSHMADCQLFGLQPWGHHLTNILLHAFNSLLVFVVLRRMTGAVWRSLAVAALFGLHPLHVESVAWVAERKDVLSAVFALLALWAYAAWVEQGAAWRGADAGRYALVVLFLAAGLLCKPMVVTIPCVLLLLDCWPLGRRGGAHPVPWGRLVLEKVPLLLLAAGASAATLVAQAGSGAVQTMSRYPPSMRVANALVAYVRYLGKTLDPAGLAVYYPYPDRLPLAEAALAGAFLALVTVAVLGWRRRHPSALAGWCGLLGMLVPVIGLVQVGDQALADRYSYLPSIGLFIAAVWGVEAATSGWAGRARVLGPAAGVLLAAGAVLTVRQLGFWRDSETLFRHALAVTGDNWAAHNGLGFALSLDPARDAEAIAEYRSVVRLAPRFAEGRYSLATVLARRADRLPEAIAEYRAALALRPGYVEAHGGLARALEQMPGRLSEAVAEYQAVTRLRPGDADAHSRLADALAQDPARRAEAAAEYRKVLALQPDWVEIRSNLGLVLAEMPGGLPAAIAEYEAVLRVKPGFAEAHNNLGSALAQLAVRAADAEAEFRAALRLRPDYVEARCNLGLLLAQDPGRRAEAVAEFEAALRGRPDFEPAREMLRRLGAAAP